MRRIFALLIIVLSILSSCKKENEDFFAEDDNGYPTIQIDSIIHSYISKDDNYFYEGLFKSKSNIVHFNLNLKANRKYRISCSQQFEDSSSISLSLLTKNTDTITISEKINLQNVLYFNSLKKQNLILQAQLQNEYNISLDYRIFFEELAYDTLQLNNNSFEYNGHFSDKVTDTCYFFPSNSYWHRWLKYANNISDTCSISYSIKSSIENKDAEFGFIIVGSDQLNKGSQFEDDLPNGIFFSIKNNQYQITQIEDYNSTIIESGDLGNPIDRSKAITLKIQTNNTDNTQKDIFINNNIITSVNSSSMNQFYIVFSDRTKETIRVFDFLIKE